ncbi:undecaprenyl-diphosphate phosphatase [Thermohalobacter berrensis]|uniref:Undecaprenyl-diphosphatase n=1 Tax=Thermohalobacter berrensis TaxID=99594 RepID=A0A419TAI9_9FIRM|nr:undecaprenyl-diphosphate phosphatase [Thermohalobacter berrensis]RKD34490.1 undecaprenyl-diphosphatase [Thermohalobacter berrensis]
MDLFKVIILAIFQGITEFLPISSSGHLVLLQDLLGIKEGNLFIAVMLHFGTLISILIVYFKDIVGIINEFFIMIIEFLKYKKINIDNEYKMLSILIIIGSIPTGLMGIFLGDVFESFYNSTLIVGFALIITGLLLWIAEKSSSGIKNVKDMNILDALLIGIFQGLAITPGISRSGSTIVGGLFRGLNKKLATRFSFLLAIPAILGASLIEFYKAISVQTSVVLSNLLVPAIIGIFVSAITGVFAIKLLIRVLEKGKLYYFSVYVWILGIMIILVENL